MSATVLVDIVILYTIAGLAFAPLFLVAGAGRIDPAAGRSGLAFRLIILPGAVALWPLLLAQWRRALRGRST